MKTQFFRVSTLLVAISSLILCAGCEEQKARAEAPVFTPAPTPIAAAADLPNTNSIPASTNAVPDQPAAKVVQVPVPPADIKASPALEEVIKLAQAGVSEEVMLAYVTNSPQAFHLNSDQIIYLNDLGVPSAVVTALLQHQPVPEGTAVVKSGAPNPLPPGAVLTNPATNIYPAPLGPQNPEQNPPVVTAPATPPAAEEPVTPTYFYSSLSPYGSWIDVQGYGLCWQPTVAVAVPTWRPYCDRGHWIWTDCGWYWYADYSWGWAPFHYGRWCSYPRIGWFWVPDTCWGPSWVSWRYTSSYCGWAPLPPAARFVSGVGFSFGGGAVGIGFDFNLSPSWYTFVPFGHFYDRRPHSYFVSGSHATTIYHNSTVINNYIVQNNGTVINHGVGVDRVSRVTGTRIPTVPVRTTTTTAVAGIRHEQLRNNGSALTVVRPQLTSVTRPARPVNAAQSGVRAEPLAGSRFVSAPKTGANASLAPKPADQGAPVVHSRSDNNTTSALRHDEPARSSTAAPAKSDPPRTSKPAVIPRSQVGSLAAAPGSSAQNAPAASTTSATPRSTLLPPVATPPAASQPQPASRPAAAPPAAAKPDTFRALPEPGNSRAAGPAAPVARSAPAVSAPVVPAPSRPQFVAPPSVAAPPSYHAEPPRNGVSRSEVVRPPPTTVPRSGNKKD